MELPEKPLDSDCCGSGCTPCVFDVYEELLAKWKEKKRIPRRSSYSARAIFRRVPVKDLNSLWFMVRGAAVVIENEIRGNKSDKRRRI
ncbi:NADH-cytochrome b5 reductase-like isoform X2 [Planococcus citri]|uniref:NADH-cytochrome b5 reductase-like isoform X2 n=1 Tax=Planococcus citri TaxID=170843 RepID=UPI0031F749BF